MIRLEAIDETNWRYPLRVSEAQKAYVAGTAALLARAYAYRRLHSRAFLVCDGETPVGMGLYYDCPELDAYDLSQFFIDERYQGRGPAGAGRHEAGGQIPQGPAVLHQGQRRGKSPVRVLRLCGDRLRRGRDRDGKAVIRHFLPLPRRPAGRRRSAQTKTAPHGKMLSCAGRYSLQHKVAGEKPGHCPAEEGRITPRSWRPSWRCAWQGPSWPGQPPHRR